MVCRVRQLEQLLVAAAAADCGDGSGSGAGDVLRQLLLVRTVAAAAAARAQQRGSVRMDGGQQMGGEQVCELLSVDML